LKKTGYFDPTTVHLWKQKYRELSPFLYQRQSMEMGLVAVVATQLWHHTFIDPTLASLPDWRSLAGLEADNRGADFSESGAAAVA
jgi:asparagine synthase (glutamine-hydrolysing)